MNEHPPGPGVNYSAPYDPRYNNQNTQNQAPPPPPFINMPYIPADHNPNSNSNFPIPQPPRADLMALAGQMNPEGHFPAYMQAQMQNPQNVQNQFGHHQNVVQPNPPSFNENPSMGGAREETQIKKMEEPGVKEEIGKLETGQQQDS